MMLKREETGLKILMLFLIPLLLYVVTLPVMPLMEPDEGRYSAISSEMNASGDYITPHLKGVIYLEKPPLCSWATALSFKMCGENAFSSRLFAGLCAWGCILLAYGMGTYFHDQKSGLYAAAVLSASVYHFAIGRLHILDMPLAFFVSLATWSGFRYFSHNQQHIRWIYLLYLASALAFLTKGLIGIVFPFAIVFLWLMFQKRWRDTLRLFSPVGILILLTVAGPWLILVQKANPDFFWFFFVQEHFLRYATTMHERYKPFYFFIPILIAGTMPWLAFLFPAFKGIGKKLGDVFSKEEALFLLTWAGLIFLFFSASSSKLVPYIAPLFPPLAVFLGHIFRTYEEASGRATVVGVGTHLPILLQSLIFIIGLFLPVFLRHNHVPLQQWWPWVIIPVALQILIIFLPEIIQRRWGKGWFCTSYLIASLFLVALLFPVAHIVTPDRSAYPLVQAVRERLPAGRELYQYKMCLYGIDFYTQMRTPIVDRFGELRFGISKLSPEEKARYFLTTPEFMALYRSGKDIYCATDDRDKVDLLRKEAPHLEILWENDRYYLLHLKQA
jgi:4-amino-4-deoxy-L-arabinose transferase-like glycosyltransferase